MMLFNNNIQLKFTLVQIILLTATQLSFTIAFDTSRGKPEGSLKVNLIQNWEDFGQGHVHRYSRIRKSVNEDINRKDIIPKGYDVNEPPPTTKGVPIPVNVSALVLEVRDIDEMHEYISMEYKLKLFWQDLRLQNLTKPGEEFRILNLDVMSRIWIPDIYIEHVKSIDRPEILTRPASLRLYPDGRLRYSARMTVTVSCPMNFKYYPADTQLCDIDMQTYGYQTHQLRLAWENQGLHYSAARLSSRVSLSNFELYIVPGDFKFTFTSYSESGQATSEYSGLRFTMVLRRNISYHLLQTYLPSIIYMLVSWLSFILPLESASERMGYCVTCLFTLTSTFGAVRQSTPTVSYIKIIDVWMVGCIFFVFLTLVQHAIISKVRRTKKRGGHLSSNKVSGSDANSKKTCDANDKVDKMEETSFTTDEEITKVKTINGETPSCKCRESGQSMEPPKSPKSNTLYHTLAKKANLYLSLIIPLLFLLFNVVYWTVIITVKVTSL